MGTCCFPQNRLLLQVDPGEYTSEYEGMHESGGTAFIQYAIQKSDESRDLRGL
jgi:hypothetical protein